MSKMKLFKFYKPDCPPCYAVSRILMMIFIPDNIELININVNDLHNKEIVNKYNIDKVPVLMFEDGKSLIGLNSKKDIENFIYGESL